MRQRISRTALVVSFVFILTSGAARAEARSSAPESPFARVVRIIAQVLHFRPHDDTPVIPKP